MSMTKAVAHARPVKIGPLTRELSGIITLPPGKDDKELLTEAIVDKYRSDD